MTIVCHSIPEEYFDKLVTLDKQLAGRYSCKIKCKEGIDFLSQFLSDAGMNEDQVKKFTENIYWLVTYDNKKLVVINPNLSRRFKKILEINPSPGLADYADKVEDIIAAVGKTLNSIFISIDYEAIQNFGTSDEKKTGLNLEFSKSFYEEKRFIKYKMSYTCKKKDVYIPTEVDFRSKFDNTEADYNYKYTFGKQFGKYVINSIISTQKATSMGQTTTVNFHYRVFNWKF